MADGQQNRFPGVRSCAHLGGAGGHARGWEGRRVSTEGWEGDGLYRGVERGWGLSGVAFHAHLETQMADGQQNRFPGVRSCAHLGGAGGHARGWEGRRVSTEGWEGDGLYRGVERGWGLSGVAFHAHLETQMADRQQNRFPGVRSFAHLGGAGGHTEGWEGRWAIPRGWEGRWAYTEGVRRAVGYTEGVGRARCLYEGREGRWAIPRGREGRWAIPRGGKGEVPLHRERGVARVHRCVGRRC